MWSRLALALVCLAACNRVFGLDEVQPPDASANDTRLGVSRRPGGWLPTSLSDEGSLDWVHWALGAEPAALNRKAGVTPLITDVLRVRGTLVAGSATGLGAMSWTDGTPTQMATGSKDFLQLESALASGDGFELEVRAGERRVATVYAGSFCVDSKLEARLGDLTEVVTSGEDLLGTTYTIDFASAAGGTLTLGFAVESNACTTGDLGELWLVGVTVAPAQ